MIAKRAEMDSERAERDALMTKNTGGNQKLRFFHTKNFKQR